MKALVFFKAHNRAGRSDATGAFIPEAEAFQKLHGIPDRLMVPIPKRPTMYTRRRFTSQTIERITDQSFGDFDAFVYFGHGSPGSLPDLGFRLRQIPQLADLLRDLLTPYARVILYACLAGKGFGFGDQLDVALGENISTISHLTAGHTAWNPHTEFSGEGPDRSGVPIIGRRDPLWRAWVERLRTDQAFRLSFPFMSQGEIETRLRGDHIPPGPSELIGPLT